MSPALPYPTTIDVPDEAALDALLDEVARAPVYRQVGPARDGAPPMFECESTRLPTTGDVLDGKYRIEHELGRGGMGVVFAAVHLATGRELAIKWLHPDRWSGTPEARRRAARRFAREARIAARIGHPQAVDVLDVGGEPERPYLVMERLKGETLRDCLEREGPMGWERAVALLRPVFGLLQAAHAAGVVHRDLKPDNVFLAREASGDAHARVLDFGIASLTQRELDDATLTRTGSVLGTPAYMPLEQLRGERDVDARADVYALAVVLYEMLSGNLPHNARNAADLAVALANEAPTPLGHHAPTLSQRQQRAVMCGLSRERSARYASMADFAAALDDAKCGQRTPVRTKLLLAVLILIGSVSALSFMGPSPSSGPAGAAPSRTPTARDARLRASAPPAPPALPEPPVEPGVNAEPLPSSTRPKPTAPAIAPVASAAHTSTRSRPGSRTPRARRDAAGSSAHPKTRPPAHAHEPPSTQSAPPEARSGLHLADFTAATVADPEAPNPESHTRTAGEPLRLEDF